MNYIIYDIEATCWDGTPLADMQEIIEIGAVMLDDYGEIKGSYDRFIKPLLQPTLSPYCMRLTSIQQSDVDKASLFPKIIEEFQDWAEIFEEDYVLCAWGSFDQQAMITNCRLHKIETDWLDSHIDLRKQYKHLKGYYKAMGLKKALHKEGFEFTGVQHRAISDAENTAKIFYKYFDEWVVVG